MALDSRRCTPTAPLRHRPPRSTGPQPESSWAISPFLGVQGMTRRAADGQLEPETRRTGCHPKAQGVCSHRLVAYRARYRPVAHRAGTNHRCCPPQEIDATPSETNEMANVANSRGPSLIERTAPISLCPADDRPTSPVAPTKIGARRRNPFQQAPATRRKSPSGRRLGRPNGTVAPGQPRIWHQGVLLVGRVLNPFPSYRKNDTATAEREGALQRFFCRASATSSRPRSTGRCCVSPVPTRRHRRRPRLQDPDLNGAA